MNHEVKRNAEFAEVQRLEEAERRKDNEKNRRIMEEEKTYQDKKAMTGKLAAQSAAKTLLKNLIPSCMAALTSNGYFYDLIEKEVEQSFLPWLNGQVTERLARDVMAVKILDGNTCNGLSLYVRSYSRVRGRIRRWSRIAELIG